MEMILNIAWALCSLALICLWARSARSNPVALRTQALSLAMVVLLLLPVISLSDDLMAMQGPAESDTCLRKAQHPSDTHPPVAPSSWAQPAAIVADLPLTGPSRIVLSLDPRKAQSSPLPHSLDSRPPPQA